MKNEKGFPVIIPAAGIGSRMASKRAKQYLLIDKKTVLEHTLDIFLSHQNIPIIVVALHPNDTVFNTLKVATHPKIKTVVGGKERVDSVLASLAFLSMYNNEEYADATVLVHDAARPCLAKLDLEKLMQLRGVDKQSDSMHGAILAVPVADTIKQAKNDASDEKPRTPLINSTIDRRHLWQAQTPQMFPLKALKNAIKAATHDQQIITDEASAMEWVGAEIKLIEGNSSNIKITRPSDLALARFYLTSLNTHKTLE